MVNSSDFKINEVSVKWKKPPMTYDVEKRGSRIQLLPSLEYVSLFTLCPFTFNLTKPLLRAMSMKLGSALMCIQSENKIK